MSAMPTVEELKLMLGALNNLPEEKLRAGLPGLPDRTRTQLVAQISRWMKAEKRQHAQGTRDRHVPRGALFHWTTLLAARAILARGFQNEWYAADSEAHWLEYPYAMLRGDLSRLRALAERDLQGPTIVGIWLTDSPAPLLPYIGDRGPVLLRVMLPAMASIAPYEFFERSWRGARDYCIPAQLVNHATRVEVRRAPSGSRLDTWGGPFLVQPATEDDAASLADDAHAH